MTTSVRRAAGMPRASSSLGRAPRAHQARDEPMDERDREVRRGKQAEQGERRHDPPRTAPAASIRAAGTETIARVASAIAPRNRGAAARTHARRSHCPTGTR